MSGLPRYGDDLSTTDIKASIFAGSLAKYSLEQIRKAFDEWLVFGEHLPCIANIVKLIEPPMIYDKAVYISIKKRISQGVFIDDQERKYLKDYESHVVGSAK